MDLDEKVTLTEGDKSIQLPKKNIILLALVYMAPLRSEFELKIAKEKVEDYEAVRTLTDVFWKFVREKLGMKPGDATLL